MVAAIDLDGTKEHRATLLIHLTLAVAVAMLGHIRRINNSSSDSSSNNSHSAAEVSGAAVAGGIAATAMAGPVVGVAAAGVAACSAQTNDGAIGDVARAAGAVVAHAGQEAKELNQRHHFTDRARVAASAALETARDADERHRIVERAKTAGVQAYSQVVKFENEHHVLQTLRQRTVDGMKIIGNKLVECSKRDTTV